MANRYFQYQAAQPVFSQVPLEYLQAGLQAKQQRYDVYQGLADELYNMQLDSLDPDRAAANAMLQDYQQDIDALVDDFKGDYSSMGPSLHKLGRTITKDFSPGGKARAIIDQKNMYEKDKALYQEMTAKGVLTADQYNAWNAHVLSNYKGVGDIDPLTQTYASIELPTITKPYEANELIDYFAKNIIPEKMQKGHWYTKDGVLWRKTVHGEEVVTPERVRAIVRQGLESHDGFMDYYDQMRQFGAPMDDNAIDMAIDRAVRTYAYKHTTDDQDIRWTPAGVLKAQAGAAAEDGMRREYRDKGINTPGFSNVIDKNNVTTVTSSTIDPRGLMGAAGASSLAAGVYTQKYANDKERVAAQQRMISEAADKGFITNYIQNGQAKKDGLDVVNFQKYWDSVKDTHNEHTKEGANAIIDGWNEVVQASDILNPQRIRVQVDALDELNKEYFDLRGIESASVIPLDGKNHEPMKFDEAMDLLGVDPDKVFMRDEDNKDQRTAAIVAIEGAENGLLPGGYVVQLPGGKQMLVEGRDENASLAYEPITRLSSIMHDPTKQQTETVTIDALGGMKVYGKKDLLFNEGTGKWQYDLQIYNADTGEPWDHPYYNRNVTLKDLRKQIDTKYYERMMPFGASAKNKTTFKGG